MTVIHRQLRLVRDEAAPAEGAATAPASRVREFIASDESVDSHNTIIKASGWVLDRFARNPVIQLFHDSRRFPVAKGTVSVVGTELRLKAEFAPADDPVSGPDAEQALRWIDRGVLGVSVGFMPLAEEYDESRESGDVYQDLFYPPINYMRQELLEVSIVNVPSNVNALPAGRAVLERAHARLLERTAPKPAPVSPEALKAMVDRITAEELQTHRSKLTGFLGGTKK